MPELGKATYTLILNTSQFDAGLARAQRETVISTDAMSASLNKTIVSTREMGVAATQTSAQFAASGTRMQGAAAAMAASSARAATVSTAAFAGVTTSINRMTASAVRGAKLAGLGALFLVAQEGVTEIRDVNEAMLQVRGVIETTGGVAAVSAKHVSDLADKYARLAGVSRGATESAETLLLTFPRIRNVVGQGNDIFDQAVEATQNLSKRFGKDLRQSAILVGKAINDPIKGLLQLRRIGVSFDASQLELIKHLIATGHGLEAQKVVLRELTVETGGAAAAYGRSLPGGLAISIQKLKEQSAVILTALIPAFVRLVSGISTVARILGQHAQALRAVIFLYIGWKAALLAVGAAAKTMTALSAIARLTQGVTAASAAATPMLLAQAGAEQAVGASAVSATGGVSRLRGALLGLRAIAPIAIPIAVGVAGLKVAGSVLGLQKKALQAGVEAAGEGERRTLVPRLAAQIRDLRAAGVPSRSIIAKLRLQLGGAPQANDLIAEAFSFSRTGRFQVSGGGEAGASEEDLNRELKRTIREKKGRKTAAFDRALALSQIRQAQAARSGSKTQELAAAREELALQQQRLAAVGNNLKRRLELEQAVTDAQGNVDSIVEQIREDALQRRENARESARKRREARQAQREKLRRAAELRSERALAEIQIDELHARRTKTLNDDIAFARQERDFLVARRRTVGRDALKRLALEQEIDAAQTKVDELVKQKQQAREDVKRAGLQAVQSALETRGTFFGEFAPNIFSITGAGLVPGPGGVASVRNSTININQANTFHEIPQDPHRLALQMRRAAAAAME